MSSDSASALFVAVFVMAAAGIGTFFGWHLHAIHLRQAGRQMADEAEEYARRLAGRDGEGR